MRHSRAFLRATGTLTAFVLAGSLLLAASASARNSTGFRVYNLTGEPIKVTNVSVDHRFDESEDAPIPPDVGDVLRPGVDKDHSHIELAYRTLYRNYAGLTYQAPQAKIKVILEDSECSDCRYKPRAFCVEGADGSPHYQCVSDGNRLLILDPPGTLNQVRRDERPAQAETLRGLCDDDNLAADLVKCKFKPKERIATAFGDSHVVGFPLFNCTSGDIEYEVEASDKVAVTNSFGLKIGTEIGKHVKIKVEAEYGYKHTEEHEFKTKLTVPVASGEKGWVQAAVPVIRVVGDFTIEMGNTTWILHDVYFDSPDPEREKKAVWIPRTKKMSDDEVKHDCGGPDPTVGRLFGAPLPDGLVRRPASRVTITRRGGGNSNTLLGGRESTTMIALGGSDIVRGASGNDRLFGGPGRDVIYGGPGSDTIVDSRGRSRVSTGKGGRDGPDSVDVRDGEGDDTVTCGSRKAVVQADKGDRLRSCG